MTDKVFDYETEYKKISLAVSSFAKDTKGAKMSFKLNTKTPLLYIAIVISVLILLVITAPSFVKEIKIEDTKEVSKMSYTKLLISTTILSFIISMSVFVYLYKNR